MYLSCQPVSLPRLRHFLRLGGILLKFSVGSLEPLVQRIDFILFIHLLPQVQNGIYDKKNDVQRRKKIFKQNQDRCHCPDVVLHIGLKGNNIKNIGAGIEIKDQEKCTAQYKREEFFAASLEVFHNMRHKEKDDAVIVYLQRGDHENGADKFHNNEIPLMFYLILVMYVHQNHQKYKKAEGNKQHFSRNRRQRIYFFQKQDRSAGVSDLDNGCRGNNGNIQHCYKIKAFHKTQCGIF